jgi:perosamine synthetase
VSDFIPQYKPWLDSAERDAVVRYLDGGGWLTEFTETKHFADAIASYTGARFCSILSNGSVTLTAALLALGVGAGDEVIVPAYTMIATANAVPLSCGATPVFADVELDTMGIDVDSARAAMTSRTKALMLVSINGRYPRRLDELLSLCRERKVVVVEDAAQSLGSFHQGRHVGRCGRVASFSFSMPKIVTTGQGGALITDDEELFQTIELIRNFGRRQAGIDDHILFGTNFKFTDLQAVIGIEQMKKISIRVELKKRTYRVLRERLIDRPQVRFFETSPETTPWFNDVLVEDPVALTKHLKARGIGARPFYPVVPTQAPYRLSAGRFPVAARLSREGLWLPSFAQLTDGEIDRIVDGIRSFWP